MSDDSKIQWSHFLSGDNDAYKWLYKTYVHTLYSYGNRFTSDAEIIKDCIQDLFVTLYNSRSRLTTPDNVKLYLMISLKNKLMRTLQKRDFYISYNPDEEPVFLLEPTVEDDYIKNEEASRQKEKVEKILSVLTPRQKEIIYYRYIQELEMDEICELMNLNYQSAKNLIQRSLAKIRENYKGSLESFLLLFILSGFFPK